MSLENFSHLTRAQQQEILESPAQPPPPGITPNLEHPPHHNAGPHATLAICTIFSVGMAFARCYCRWFQSPRFDLSDFLLILSLGCFCGYISICYHFLILAGYFIHTWDLKLNDSIYLSYLLHVGNNLYGIIYPTLKSAILIEWMNLFLPRGKRGYFYWVSLLLIALLSLWYCGLNVAENFHCVPYKRIWDVTVPGLCYDWRIANIMSNSINLGTDIILLGLPQKAIWSLHMSQKQKLGVSALFATGFIACVCSTITLANTVAYYNSSDAAYRLSHLTLAVAGEMTCGYIVIGLPYVPRIIGHFGFMTKIMTSLLTWAHMDSWHSHNSGQTPRSDIENVHRTPPATERRYQMMVDTDGIPLENINDDGPSAMFFSRPATRPDERIQGSGILLTTNIVVDATPNTNRAKPLHAHPWEG
ncbi:hypothetical protein F5Y11DRAFT_55566 [Daldinia sp. FL1419]|nr:hypothetical protein F5Y11DRAFT_55566 [Daldinia sp. FL1419]